MRIASVGISGLGSSYDCVQFQFLVFFISNTLETQWLFRRIVNKMLAPMICY